MTIIFRNKTIFYDISKWNRWQKKWDGWSSNLTNKLLCMTYILRVSMGRVKLRLKLLPNYTMSGGGKEEPATDQVERADWSFECPRLVVGCDWK